MDYHYADQGTQLALFSLCLHNCASMMSIRWSVEHGSINVTTSAIQWTSITPLSSSCIFGKNSLHLTRMPTDDDVVGVHSKNLTVTKDLFSQHNESLYWRFAAIYSFASATINQTFDVELNHPPRYGSCSMHPHNGTLMTLFTIQCSHWFDDDLIKDYSFYGLYSLLTADRGADLRVCI